MILLHKLVNENGGITAVRALIIAKFFQRDRSGWVVASVNRFARVFPGNSLMGGKTHKMRPFCAIKQCSTPERRQRDNTDDDKGQIPFHYGKSARSFSA